MTTSRRVIPPLEDIKIHVRFKLFALWSALIFLYVYGDYFELYQPGKLQEMIGGRMALGAITQGVLLGMSALLAIPSLMVFLSLVLPPLVDRWMNIILGIVYTLVMFLAMKGAWHFYVFFGLIEITLTALIVWYAWTWPRSQMESKHTAENIGKSEGGLPGQGQKGENERADKRPS